MPKTQTRLTQPQALQVIDDLAAFFAIKYYNDKRTYEDVRHNLHELYQLINPSDD